MIGFVLFVCSVLGVVVTAEGKSKDSPNEVLLNICTNGRDPNQMTLKDYMTEFAAGPCSPVILYPGIMGSVLRVIIDCPQLRLHNPEAFLTCGWTTCSTDVGHSLKSSPKKEYQIWIPDLESPMSLVVPTETSRLCFGMLVEQGSQVINGTLTPVNRPGVTFSVQGFTPETQGYNASKCGNTGIENLIPGIVNPQESAYFRDIIYHYEYMGLRAGLTYQAMPYDFRVNSGNDLASKGFGQLVKNMKLFTNKKVVVAGHSMGNNKIVYGLWNMNQQDKDNNIAMYIAMAPPYLGAPKVINYLTCGDSGFFFIDFGIDMRTFKLSVGTFFSVYELAPSRTYMTEAGTPWMNRIHARMAYEAGQSSDPVYPFLPSKDLICYPKFTYGKNCTSGRTRRSRSRLFSSPARGRGGPRRGGEGPT